MIDRTYTPRPLSLTLTLIISRRLFFETVDMNSQHKTAPGGEIRFFSSEELVADDGRNSQSPLTPTGEAASARRRLDCLGQPQ